MPVRSYTEISDKLEADIRAGRIKHQLPTQKQLCYEFGSSNRTVDKALQRLKAIGLVYSIHGRGYYVKKEG